MNVKQIVLQYLKDNGYDGLANDNGECGCDLEDLMPCGYQDAFCEVGHKVEVSPEESEYGEKWVIKPGKRAVKSHRAMDLGLSTEGEA